MTKFVAGTKTAWGWDETISEDEIAFHTGTGHDHDGTNSKAYSGVPAAHNLGGASHDADTLANLNTKISDATLDGTGDTRTPKAHAASHASGSGDDISSTYMLVATYDPGAIGANAFSCDYHVDGTTNGTFTLTDGTKLDGIAAGADVTGANAPQAHGTSHGSGGGDDLSSTYMLVATYDSGAVGANAFDCDNHINGTTNGTFTLADGTKLDGIAAGANVTGDNPPQAHVLNGTLHTVSGLTDGHVMKVGTGGTAFGFEAEYFSINFIADGGGTALGTGEQGHVIIETAGTIQSCTVIGDASGTISFDIWKAAGVPTGTDTICGTANPGISGTQKTVDSTLTGWTTAISVGDCMAYNIESNGTVERATVQLKVLKS